MHACTVYMRRVSATVLLAGVLLAPASAFAAVRPMSIDSVARAADSVVVVRVIAQQSRVAGDGDGAGDAPVVTDTRLHVERALSGSGPTDITLTQPGGTLHGVTLVLSELPAFAVGERCLLFLDAEGAVVGAEQGRLDIVGEQVPQLGRNLDELDGYLAQVSAPDTRLTAGGGAPRSSQPAAGSATSFSDALTTLANPSPAVVLGLAAVTPAMGRILPADLSAGIGDVVTITGAGFGSSRGTVSFRKPGLQGPTTVAAPVISWSDTVITCEIPRYAEAGPVVLTTATGKSTALNYHVQFSTGGQSWKGPVVMRVNPNFSGTTDEVAAIQRAMSTWSECGSYFSMVYGGSCTTVANTGVQNGYNDVHVAPASSFGDNSPYILAWNYHWYTGSGEIVESDVRFNSAWAWGNGSGGTYDIETVALHELGHSVSLDDQYDNDDKAMGSYRGVRRTLSADDIAGAVHLYGSTQPPVEESPVPGAPTVTSTTHPVQTAWRRGTTATFGYWATGSLGISQYAVLLDRSPSTVPEIGTPVTSATQTYTNLAEGEHWFHVRACSPNGEWGPASHYRVRIDLTPPASSADATATYEGVATVHLSAKDAKSGVSSISYGVDGASMTSYPGAITVVTPGEHTVRFAARDVAGNKESARTATFTVTPRIAGASVVRVGGATRYAVMRSMALKAFPGWIGIKHVVIASGEDRAAADPLCSAGLAGAYDAPVLIVAANLSAGKASAEVESALAGIRSANGGSVQIHVVGGAGSVSDAVYRRLSALKGPAGGIERITGANRYGLSATVASRVVSRLGAGSVPGVLIANGENPAAFYDALAASPVSYATHRPLLLTSGTTLRSEAASVLKGSLAGKPATAVNSSKYLAAAVLSAAGTSARMTTASGRTSSASQIAAYAVSHGWLENRTLVIANKLPDALTGGSAVGRHGGVVLYTSASDLDSRTVGYLAAWKPAIFSAWVAGGTASVSASSLSQAQTILR